MTEIHREMRLHTTEDNFIVDPSGYAVRSDAKKLVIDRRTGALSFQNNTGHGYNPSNKVDDIYGIIGTVKLLSGWYLLVITGRRLMGKINGHDIWKVTKTKIIRYNPEPKLSLLQEEDELQYQKMIGWILSMDGFYFSYTYDVTHSLQRIYGMPDSEKEKPLHQRVDARFWWNKNILQDFINAKMDSWILPIMLGFVESHACQISGKNFDFMLISRRHIKRAGTRFYMRGVDAEGNVANAVETEQIISLPQNGMSGDGRNATPSAFTSIVQTRGSIPLFWKQTPNLKYKPKPVIYGLEIETPQAFRRHMDELVRHYQKVTAINLIDQKGSELALANQFERQAKSFSDSHLKYVAFDFHYQCRNMRWDRLSILIDQIRSDIDKNQFFYVDDGKIQKRQEGIFRTNCMDNLDRTNVVQSLIAKESLTDQLMQLGILRPNQTIGDFPPFYDYFRNVWANHADVISMQYSGTGALKTDFTRTGKRTLAGVASDGMNSLTRYYLNNFQDGFRQDAFDLFLGNYTPAISDASPFLKATIKMTYLLIAAGVVLVCSLMLPAEGRYLLKAGILGMWAVLAFAAWRVMIRYGTYFVNKPMLFLRDQPVTTAKLTSVTNEEPQRGK